MRATYSCFIMSVGEDWYLVTAGHCLDEVAKALASGYTVHCELIDNLLPTSKFKQPIPFDYQGSNPVSVDEVGADFGIMELGYLYREQLRANGMLPLSEQGWALRPQNYQPFKYLLLGIPSELTEQQGNIIRYQPSIHPVEKLEQRPDYIPEPKVPTFYGKVFLGDDLDSIDGMSGGPIFSLQEVDGKVKYWLHALQSGWYRSERVIVAPLIQSLGLALSRAHESLRIRDQHPEQE